MLSVILVLFALLYTNYKFGNYRTLICGIVFVPAIIHYYLFNDALDFEYYGTAGVASFIVISALEFVKRTPLALDIQVLNGLMVGANFFGYLTYHAELEPIAYNFIINVLFVVEFLRLVIVTKKDREYGLLNRNDTVRHDASGHGMGGSR